jgi:L-asparaginase II
MTVEVTRGGIVESTHRVAACVATSQGEVIFAAGDVEAPVYLRSSAKPFIAAAAIAAGVRERFGLDDREIAVMSASHFGEPFHIEAVRSLLHKVGLGTDALQCGAHLPYDEASAQAMLRVGGAPSALHNNCSGKHAGILALCRVLDVDVSTYLEPSNPAQQAILNFCARMSDDDPQRWPLGVDGCGIPVYATGMRRAAMAFARLATLACVSASDALALARVRDAMMAYPDYVAGTGRFDSVMLRAGAQSLVCKSGAEGVFGMGLPARGVGFAAKIADGGGRARPPVAMAALRFLGSPIADATELQPFKRPIVYNRAGRVVGEVRLAPDFAVE